MLRVAYRSDRLDANYERVRGLVDLGSWPMLSAVVHVSDCPLLLLCFLLYEADVVRDLGDRFV
jgi:hypothetical protein